MEGRPSPQRAPRSVAAIFLVTQESPMESQAKMKVEQNENNRFPLNFQEASSMQDSPLFEVLKGKGGLLAGI